MYIAFSDCNVFNIEKLINHPKFKFDKDELIHCAVDKGDNSLIDHILENKKFKIDEKTKILKYIFYQIFFL